MVCVPGASGNLFIGGDAPFEMPSTTIFPHGFMSSVTVPKAAAAEGGGTEGSIVGATVGVLGATSTVFASGTGSATGAGGTGMVSGAATGAAGVGIGSDLTSVAGAVVAAGFGADCDARPANKR